MSWLKKIFQRFNDSNDDRDFNENNDEIFNDEQPLYNKRKNHENEEGSRVNAKVYYQYPKGKFKFPLIPDIHAEERNNQINERRTKQDPLEQTFHGDQPLEGRRNPSTRSRKPSEIKTVPRPNNDGRTEKKSEPSITQEKKKSGAIPESRRPFRPTEIPSPIYGFNRPKRNENPNKNLEEEVVEFELNSFSPFNEKAETSQPAIHFDSNSVSANELSSKEQTNNEVFLNTNSEVIEQPELPPFDSTEEIVDELFEPSEEIISVESNDILSVYHEIAASQDDSVNKFGNDYKDEEAEEMESFTDVSLFENREDEYNDASQHVLVENVESASTVELENEVEQNERQINVESEYNLEASSFLRDEIHIENEEVQAEPTMDAEFYENSSALVGEDDPIEEEPLEQSRRTHIPFNVIMLKQDKVKLEEKRLTEEPLTESILIDEEDDNDNEDAFEPIYYYPSEQLLIPPAIENVNTRWLEEQEELLNQTLINFNVGAKVVNVTKGPSVTRFEVQPEPGVKVNKITNLTDDIKLSLAARDIRIEAPIPGKHTIGIEVPNESSRPVFISEIINSSEFKRNESPLTAVLGLDISGKPIVTDLRKMPHGLIAGATGSGKSVCINCILVSLLYKANPNDLKLLLIDPKMVELAPYNQIPHLVSPVITDVKAATAALKWAVEEMERRYELFAHTGVRDIKRFNELAMEHKRYSDKLPYIVIIIDELADLMMMSPADVEEAICRIAQKARACGIHLIIATQRPSVDVITGLIKANVPTRIAFSVSSQVDSRTIIDIGGAEKLLGRGDMLFLENGSSKPVRLQGTYVSDQEIDAVVGHVREQREPEYLFQQEELLKKAQITEEEDELFYEACEFVVDQGSASTSSLQRNFRIGYNRAARLIDMMEQQGIISEARGSKPRDVLITATELETI